MADSSISTAATLGQAQRRSAFIVIVLGNFLLTFGFRIWQSLFNNFAVQELGVRAGGVSLAQSIREIPGLVSLVVGLAALLLPEMRIAGLSIIVMGVGLALTGATNDLVSLMVSTFLMSLGFHFFMPVNSSAVLLLVGEDEAPHTLGWLSSLNAVFALAGAAVVFLSLDVLGTRTLFYAVGALLVIGGLALQPWIRQPVRPARAKQRGYIRKRYWLYYILEFLMGSRRHIFTTFAIFLLVKDHLVAIGTVTILYAVNDIIGTFVYRQFGEIIARFGERRILTYNFTLLVFVFLGYAYVPWLPALFVLFVADHLLFGFSIALQSYFQKIAVRPQDITPNLSLGQAINHVAAVIIPLVGGVVWQTVGSRYTFLVGVGIVVLSLIMVQWMRWERGGAPLVTARGYVCSEDSL
jgi:predicted MFS family arabinose efflux permease